MKKFNVDNLTEAVNKGQVQKYIEKNWSKWSDGDKLRVAIIVTGFIDNKKADTAMYAIESMNE